MPPMIEEELAFLKCITEAGDDVAPRRVFADWLDEAGRHEEADYQRSWTPHVGKLEARLQQAREKIELLEVELGELNDPCGC